MGSWRLKPIPILTLYVYAWTECTLITKDNTQKDEKQ